MNGESVIVATLVEALRPLANLRVPTKPQGNAGIYSIYHKQIEAARTAIALANPLSQKTEELCDDCPPVGYPTDKTRCLPCPRRAALANPDPQP